jgi:hypothetical protein
MLKRTFNGNHSQCKAETFRISMSLSAQKNDWIAVKYVQYLVYQTAVSEVRGDYVSVLMYLTNLRGIRGSFVSRKAEVFGACTSFLGRQQICQ